jgi:hypothetical protein
MVGVGMGEHGHDRGNLTRRQLVGMRGVVGPGLDRHSDQPPVLGSDRIVAEHRLVGEGND